MDQKCDESLTRQVGGNSIREDFIALKCKTCLRVARKGRNEVRVPTS